MLRYKRNSNPNYYDDYCSNANCGSYAFNLQGWYDPEIYLCNTLECGFVCDGLKRFFDEGYDCYDVSDIYADILADGILEEFEDELRLLSTATEPIDKDEELIAMRTFAYDEGYGEENTYVYSDFHFRVFRNGKWMEKCGKEEVKECDDINWGNYISNTYYFAHRIGGEEK